MNSAIKLGEHLNTVWNRHTAKLDVLGLEQTLEDVLRSELDDAAKVAFCKETLDAYTRRGHFQHSEYPEAR